MSRLAARVLTGTTLACGAALLLWLHARYPDAPIALAVVTALTLLSAWELAHMGALRGRGLGLALAGATLVLAFGLYRGWPGLGADTPALLRLALLYLYAGMLAVPGFVAALFVGASAETQARSPLEAVAAALWIVPPLFAIALVEEHFGTRGLVALIVLAKVGDNAGYFVGRAIGKRHPFPRVSPGKTVAGCVASLVAGVAAGAALLPFTVGERSLAGVALGGLFGGLINVAAQAGDLSESWVKRKAGVKDSSALLGPSGGVLDVIDSLLLAAPVALLLWSA